MYLCMGIADCIVPDAAAYVDLAVRLGTDPAFNASIRARILEHNHVLYENRRVVQEFERFFMMALRERAIPIEVPAAADRRLNASSPRAADPTPGTVGTAQPKTDGSL